MRIGRSPALYALIATLAWIAPAVAHMPYLLPSVFDASGRRGVTVAASFTEDAFRPEIAMQDAPFEITGPDGRTSRLAAPQIAGDVTLVDVPLPADGIYRLSSGQRLGRAGRMYRKGEAWVMAPEAGAPAGATVVEARSATIADAYVVRGKPGALGALTPRGKALEILPLGDPTGYTPGSAARVELLFDGKPLAGVTAMLFREKGFYDGRKLAGEVRSGADGAVALTPPDAGRYLMLVRYRPTPVPGVVAMSYTATLAFEVI